MPAGDPLELLAAAFQRVQVGDQLGAIEAVEHRQLGGEPALIGVTSRLDDDPTFGAALQGIEGPEQGAGLEDEDSVMPLPVGLRPELLAQAIKPLPFAAGLPLDPAF